MTYGQIGRRGRSVTYSAADDAAAAALIRHCLHRRASAPKRIAMGYLLVSRIAVNILGTILPPLAAHAQNNYIFLQHFYRSDILNEHKNAKSQDIHG